MKKTALFLILLLSMTSGVFAGLTNLCTSVMDNGMIEITYQLVSEDPTNTLPVFAVSFTGEIAGKKPFDLKTLEGAGKTGVLLGEGSYTSYWNVAKDCKREDPFAITVNAKAEEVTDEATYLCLDLKKYKMRYQNDPPDVTKSACKTKELWLRRIEPGIFTMGRTKEEIPGRGYGDVQHKIKITKAYYIGVFETTQKQFKTIAGYNFSRFKGSTRPIDCCSFSLLRGMDKGPDWPNENEVDEYVSIVLRKYSRHQYYTLHPKENLPTFFNALRSATGYTLLFDLPMEAQWEYACRAGTTSSLYDGNNLTNYYIDGNLNKLARYLYNGGEEFNKKGKQKDVGHNKVGSYLPNAWGLYDMLGNVNELCLGYYCATNIFKELIILHKRRGGDWRFPAAGCTSSGKQMGEFYSYGGILADDVRIVWDYPGSDGFRVALVQKQSVFLIPDDKIKKDFEFTISSGTGNTLPVFEVKLYGQLAGGLEYPLEEMGKVEYDGASGIVVGKGKHKLTWTPSDAYTNLVDEVKLRVEYEDVTSQATYLVLDLPSNKMRTSASGPNIGSDKCRTEELWLRRIEPGTFTMGSPEDELGRFDNETQHRVTLTKAYYIGVFEMTQKQFISIYGWRNFEEAGDERPAYDVHYELIRGYNDEISWPSNNFEVEKGSFLDELRKKAGNIFDLPTEAQWEYACRAGTTTALNNNKNITSTFLSCPNMDQVGRYWNNGGADAHYRRDSALIKVGSYLPNAWGLYDMHGNVYEWCLDWYQSDIGYAATDPKGADSGSYRVLRGGCWYDHADRCRSAYRNGSIHVSGYYICYGFRVALVQ